MGSRMATITARSTATLPKRTSTSTRRETCATPTMTTTRWATGAMPSRSTPTNRPTPTVMDKETTPTRMTTTTGSPTPSSSTAGSNPLNAASTPEVCDGADNDLNEGVDEGFANTDGDAQANCVDADDDNDGVPDGSDAFPLDSKRVGRCRRRRTRNNADTDDDNDGQSDVDETACGSNPLSASSKALDTDQDTRPNCVDADDDGDGVSDSGDNCPLAANANQADTDDDAIGDVCDPTPGGGGAIVFASTRAGNFEIYGMAADGSNPVRSRTTARATSIPFARPTERELPSPRRATAISRFTR